MSSKPLRRMSAASAILEAKRLLGDFAFLDFKDGQYRIVRAASCGLVDVVGTGRSLGSALADAELWLGIYHSEDSRGIR